MTAPLTLDQIEDAEEFVMALEHHRRISEPALDDVGMSEHQRSVALVRLAFADLKIRSAADDLLKALHAQVRVTSVHMRRAGFSDQDITDSTSQARAAIARAEGSPAIPASSQEAGG